MPRFTEICLWSNSAPFNSSMAFWPAASSGISTKPKPLDLLVSLSVMILAEETSPYSENKSFKSASVVLNLN